MYKILRKNRANCTSGGGFTLAELLIVVAVIAVLVAVAIPTFSGQLEKSRQSVDVSTLRQAYAVAKIAIINQDGNNKSMYGTNTTSLYEHKESSAIVEGTTFSYWYNVKNETLDADKPDENSYGKATMNSLKADTAQLPTEITYVAGTTLANSGIDEDRDGTTQKAVLVTFIYNAATGFTVQNITYAYQSVSLSATISRVVVTASPVNLAEYVKLSGGSGSYKYSTGTDDISVTGSTGGTGWAVTDVGSLTYTGTLTANTQGSVKVKVEDTTTPTPLTKDVTFKIYAGASATVKAATAPAVATTGWSTDNEAFSDIDLSTVTFQDSGSADITVKASSLKLAFKADATIPDGLTLDGNLLKGPFTHAITENTTVVVRATFQDTSGNWYTGDITVTFNYKD